MSELNLSNVAAKLADAIDEMTARLDPVSGGLVPAGSAAVPTSGSNLPEAGATSIYVAACAYLHVVARRHAAPRAMTSQALPPAAVRGMEFLLASQRPSGLIDLLNANYDSAPDTAFAVQALAPLLEVGADLRADDDAWDHFLGLVEEFVRRAVPGMISGGFHTPNHRWVISAALALAGRHVPGVADTKPAILAFLAESIDIDEEGAFLERSIGVYDGICDRSLFLIAEIVGHPEAGRAALANLEFDRHLLQADGSAETGLSHRQDYGTRVVPLSLAPWYLYSSKKYDIPEFVWTAGLLWGAERAPNLTDLSWLAYVLLKSGDPSPATGDLPSGVRAFPANRLWRYRRDALTVSAFGNVTHLLRVCFGEAELVGLKISQSYFGEGRFIADRMEFGENRVTLHSDGRRNRRRPGYEQALGRRVNPGEWWQAAEERGMRPMPPAAASLDIRALADGLALTYRTQDNLDGVCGQMALDFKPGGIWETDDTSLMPVVGQVIFLKRGTARMRYGADVIEVSGGAHAHAMWGMRDSEGAGGGVRVLLTFLTPVEHQVRIRAYRGL